MISSYKIIGTVAPNREIKKRLDSLLSDQFNLISKASVNELISLLRSKSFCCVIIYFEDEKTFSLSNVLILKRQFPSIPLLGIIETEDIELARQCGSNGIDKLIGVKDIRLIKSVVAEVLDKFQMRITLDDFDIDLASISELTLKALRYIEINYVDLKGVQEIAGGLGINESTLSREFKNNGVVGPKRMLLYFKLKYAMRLMRNQGLTIKEITFLSGFSNAKRFNECFNKVFGCSPGVFRERDAQEVLEKYDLQKIVDQI